MASPQREWVLISSAISNERERTVILVCFIWFQGPKVSLCEDQGLVRICLPEWTPDGWGMFWNRRLIKNSLSHRVPQKCHVGGDMSHILLIPAMLLRPTKQRCRKVPSRSNKFFWGFTASAPTRDLEEMQKGSQTQAQQLLTPGWWRSFHWSLASFSEKSLIAALQQPRTEANQKCLQPA